MNTVKSKDKIEQSINSYLLGQGTEEEQKSIEDRYFRDPDFYEQMLALEDELIHDYLKGLLPPSQKALFESHFLRSDRRNQKFLFLRNLIHFVDENHLPVPVAAAPSLWRRLTDELRSMLPMPMIGLAAAAALLIAVLSGVVVFNKFNLGGGTRVEEMAQNRSQEERAPAPTSAEPPSAEGRPTLEESSPKPAAKRESTTSQILSSLPAFAFSVASVRQNEAELFPVNIAENTSQIRLDVRLDKEMTHSAYAVTIHALSGKGDAALVLRQEKVKPIRTAAGRTLWIPVDVALLEDGKYVLNVTVGDNHITEIFFNVQRH